ncbi:Hypothetical protein FKW44_008943, partial [Caligus rogercresseyi]
EVEEEKGDEDDAKQNNFEHGYAYPDDKDLIRKKCEELKSRVSILNQSKYETPSMDLEWT